MGTYCNSKSTRPHAAIQNILTRQENYRTLKSRNTPHEPWESFMSEVYIYDLIRTLRELRSLWNGSSLLRPGPEREVRYRHNFLELLFQV